jgi:hypothetical protein
MAKVTGKRNYTADQMTKVRTAFSFLNGGSPASADQMGEWIDDQVQVKVLRYYQRIESTKADAAAATAAANL